MYNPTPVFRQQTLQRFPQIRKILNRIATAITAKDITAMNYRHDVKQERSKLLAREWIDKNLRILK